MEFIKNRIRSALCGLPLHGKALVKDPSDELIEVHLATLKWNLQQLRMGLVPEDCDKLQIKSIELLSLRLLKFNMLTKLGSYWMELLEGTQHSA